MIIPNDLRVYAAQAHIPQPTIQKGYMVVRGGLGTVIAIAVEQPILIHQARNSIQKRKG